MNTPPPPNDPVEAERGGLLAAYRQLPAAEQTVVRLLAVNWSALNKTQIATALRKLASPDTIKNINWQGLLEAKLLFSSTQWNGLRLVCNPLIVEVIARDLVLEGSFNAYVNLARIASPLQKSHLPHTLDEFVLRDEDEMIRETRLGLYWRDETYINKLFKMPRQSAFFGGQPQRWPKPATIYAIVCANPFDAEWFQGLPDSIRSKALPQTLSLLAGDWRCDPKAIDMLTSACQQANPPPGWRGVATMLAIYRGELAVAEQQMWLDADPGVICRRRGLLALLRGDANAAVENFREGLALQRAKTGNRKAYFPGPLGLFCLIALYERGAKGDAEEARKLIGCIDESDPFANAYLLLGQIPALELNHRDAFATTRNHLAQLAASGSMNPWEFWIGLLILFRYQAAARSAEFLPAMETCRRKAQAAGFAWLEAEMSALIAGIDPARVDAKEMALAFESKAGIKLLAHRAERQEPWERALKAISNTAAHLPTVNKDKTEVETRLAWLVSPNRHSPLGYSLEVREQARTAKGGWSKGKSLSFKRLRESASNMPSLNEQDVRTLTHIGIDRVSNTHYLGEKAWLNLAGHPFVFWKESGIPLELATAEPELRVRKLKSGEDVRIEFWPVFAGSQKVAIAEDGLTRLKVIELKPEHHQLAEIIGDGLEAPLAAQERILESLSGLASLVTIHSDIGGAELSAAESVESDPRPRIQLIPEREGLRIAMLVRPFGAQGSYYAPGSGGAGVIAEINGKRLQTQRDLEKELALADEILTLCPSLVDRTEAVQAWQWLSHDPESSLECLMELRAIGEKAEVEWPQGEKFKLIGQTGLNRLTLKIQQQRDWFSVSGELTLDNGDVINMQRLLELTAGSRSKFIRLDENQFIALTDALRKRLEDLRSYTEKHGKDQRIHHLALPVFEEIADEVGEFEADAQWREQVDKLRRAEQFEPKLPSTLQAELRDYQLEGFAWLSRLAAWGVGACLADDMGLGKTLQAIALILTRAGEGPSLVVAPTSVCFNWHSEVDRFAPTLNVKFLGAADRQQLIDSLEPMDLLICSYGLLQQEAVGELLGSVKFRTIVLDEAQAIKNAATKRSQQAMALQGEFKLITTGTPVENHLGELWNLMRFVNPGLLGSADSFNRRFAGPIERNQDREAKHRLKRLIQPFILRRTKSQVLDELPPRTEIELQVELSEKEATFYEALRRKLMDELAATSGQLEDKRFQVLAAITKLRRACCNPQLVAPGLGLPSSKLELFGEVLDELLDNRHKALVFSQFVDHLSIIRAHLDGKGISYQYLDGQTPAPERKKRVEAFQAGQGDVFLISLKAGGVGLNLTAADYVIHMDPWWNPAVEDQASDRAHRIGQHRPVTVYRLVTKGTIEEQIVSLHRQKRDLADSLLEGGEISGKVGAEELLALMREG